MLSMFSTLKRLASFSFSAVGMLLMGHSPRLAGVIGKQDSICPVDWIQAAFCDAFHALYIVEEIIPAAILGTLIFKPNGFTADDPFKSSCFVFQLYWHHLIIYTNSDIDMHVFVVQPWYVLQPDVGFWVQLFKFPGVSELKVCLRNKYPTFFKKAS